MKIMATSKDYVNRKVKNTEIEIDANDLMVVMEFLSEYMKRLSAMNCNPLDNRGWVFLGEKNSRGWIKHRPIQFKGIKDEVRRAQYQKIRKLLITLEPIYKNAYDSDENCHWL